MAEDDQDSKTEQPSSRKLEEAFKRGQIPFSREVSHFLILFVLALTVAWAAPTMLYNAKVMLTPFLRDAEQFQMDPRSVGITLTDAFGQGLLIIMIPVLAVAVMGILSALLQNGVVFSAGPISPKLEKISPLKGLKRMFSLRSVVEFLKGLLKLSIVAWVAWLAVEPHMIRLKRLPDDDTYAMLLFLKLLGTKLMIGVCIAMFFIALLDFMYQRFEFMKSMRMSKQEVKDEYKQQEGDPVIKQRLRALRMERARKRMMAAVPKSDVVITNPTHYSIALQYDATTMKAPKVVAKGIDHLALRIREVAKEHNIALVENPPLARALYGAVEIDEEIPLEHYKAVAEIISFVYKRRGKLA